MKYDLLISKLLGEENIEGKRRFKVVELDVKLDTILGGRLIPTLVSVTKVSGNQMSEVLEQARKKWPTSEDAYTNRALLSEERDLAAFWVNKKKVVVVIGDKSIYWNSNLNKDAERIIHDSTLILQRDA